MRRLRQTAELYLWRDSLRKNGWCRAEVYDEWEVWEHRLRDAFVLVSRRDVGPLLQAEFWIDGRGRIVQTAKTLYEVGDLASIEAA